MATHAISHPSTSDAGQHASNALIGLAKLGYAARGVVYLIVGGLAVMAAAGTGGETTGTKGALSSLTGEPWGRALLGLLALGLLGYSLWRFVQSYWDTDRHGRDGKGLAIRAGLMVSAVTHVVLAVWAATAALASGRSGGGDDGAAKWVSWLSGKPGGWILVGLIGLAVIGAGVAHIAKGYRYKFEKYLDLDYKRWPWAQPLCRFGLIMRGIVFLILGSFFVKAALDAQADEARGLGGVLEWIGEQPWGWVLLGIVALGLIAFGLYSLIQAVYRRIDPPSDLTVAPQ